MPRASMQRSLVGGVLVRSLQAGFTWTRVRQALGHAAYARLVDRPKELDRAVCGHRRGVKYYFLSRSVINNT